MFHTERNDCVPPCTFLSVPVYYACSTLWYGNVLLTHTVWGWGTYGLIGWSIYGSNRWGSYGKVSTVFWEICSKNTGCDDFCKCCCDVMNMMRKSIPSSPPFKVRRPSLTHKQVYSPRETRCGTEPNEESSVQEHLPSKNKPPRRSTKTTR